MGNPLASLPTVLGLAFLLLAGCAVDKGGPEADGGDGEGGLPVGHYLVDEEKDGELGTEDYFVVLSDSTWEHVNYWISYGNAVCGILRDRGTYYTLGDSSLVLIHEERAEGPDHCPITQSDFDNVIWEADTLDDGLVMDIRNVTANTFEARGGFATTGWKTFYKQDDPHGYFD